jgi:hypothetical protein
VSENKYYISAGLVPIDNSSGATSNTFYISAGLVPDDTAAGTTTVAPLMYHYQQMMRQ